MKGYNVQCRVQGLGFRVQGSGYTRAFLRRLLSCAHLLHLCPRRRQLAPGVFKLRSKRQGAVGGARGVGYELGV